MEKKIGVVDDFYPKVNVAAFKLDDELTLGDTIHIQGHTTNLMQKVASMQIDKKDVSNANIGDSVGIKVESKVRKGDIIYKVIG
ncbi:MAG: translation elongation factor-like protein [Candidatus Goldbacteria bacterium]|nr:translation elongation factor-like protein [Candidatus Goldiibacteriota bacterium]